MRDLLSRFRAEDQAQDLVEYTLLLAMVCLASAAMFIGGGGTVKGIWSTANSQLVAGSEAAS